MTEKIGLIFERIAAVMDKLGPISKDRTNTGQGYKFRGIDDVYNELNPILAANKVFTVPEVLEDRTEERTTSKGSLLIYRVLKMKYTFYTTDGSSVHAVVIGEGMDSGDKASNKAMAVAHKYALMQVFSIPTEDAKDPETADHDIAPKKTTTNIQPKPVSTNYAPTAVSGNLAEYVIPYGHAKIKGKMLGQVSAAEIREAITFWKTKGLSEQLGTKMVDFINTLETYLQTLPNQQQQPPQTPVVPRQPSYDLTPPDFGDDDIPF